MTTDGNPATEPISTRFRQRYTRSISPRRKW
jgi:hypothetical protein